MSYNNKLNKAKIKKDDEFYTLYSDIEKELEYYINCNKDVFKDKTILCPCDDPTMSNFTLYFIKNFKRLGLKKFISTSYGTNIEPHFNLFDSDCTNQKDDINSRGKIYTLSTDYNFLDTGITDLKSIKYSYLKGCGDFRSAEIKLLRNEADVIITNPPFSLFKEFLNWIIEANKQFLILGNLNAITYKSTFNLIQLNKLWLGVDNNQKNFTKPNNTIQNLRVLWFTNIKHNNVPQKLELMTADENLKNSTHKIITENGYVKYDNYDAIEVPFIDSIPSNYDGYMGVPVTFLQKFNPEQFEIIKLKTHLKINKHEKYPRIIIHKK